MDFAPTINEGRKVCWVLAAVDAVLGVSATFFPSTYLSLVHPALPAAEAPVDWVVRTGLLWLMMLVFELCGALSAAPAKWFFCVAMIRLMEVPADLAYGLLARGAGTASYIAIFAAPPVNVFAGTYLLLLLERSRTRHDELE
jgi:hypothetical protein